MPNKKSAREMTDDEIAQRIFPKRVIEVVKKMAEKPEKPKSSESPHK